jgi:ATP/maltotriose-dependent transcriptional regulator MalT
MIEVLVLQAHLSMQKDLIRPRQSEEGIPLARKGISAHCGQEPMVLLLHLARSRQIEMEYVNELLSVMEKVAGKIQPPSQLLITPLTIREMEVLRLIEAGCSNQDIAGNLFISIPTVKRHISNIYAKLGVKSRTQAVAIGKELKIFE